MRCFHPKKNFLIIIIIIMIFCFIAPLSFFLQNEAGKIWVRSWPKPHQMNSSPIPQNQPLPATLSSRLLLSLSLSLSLYWLTDEGVGSKQGHEEKEEEEKEEKRGEKRRKEEEKRGGEKRRKEEKRGEKRRRKEGRRRWEQIFFYVVVA